MSSAGDVSGKEAMELGFSKIFCVDVKVRHIAALLLGDLDGSLEVCVEGDGGKYA